MNEKRKIKKSVKIAAAIFIVIAAIIITYALTHSFETVESGEIEEVEVEEDLTDDGEGEILDLSAKLNVVVYDTESNGQAILIDYDDQEILVDVGPESFGKELSEKINDFVDGNIEYLIATNLSAERVGGFKDIYKNYTVDNILHGEVVSSSLEKRFAKASEEEGKYTKVKDSMIEIANNISLTIYDVPEGYVATDAKDKSLMTLLTYGSISFFSPSDASAEREIYLRGQLPECKVVVAGRNGAADENILLDELEPQFLVVPCGKDNKEGYPSKELIDAADAAGSTLYRTWRTGDLTFISDGTDVEVETERKHKEQ